MFVAHIDESGKGGSVFVVAGMTSTVERWVQFSEEWQRILSMRPATTHFKFSALGANVEKLSLFVKAINKHVERADVSLIHVAAQKKIFSGIGVTYDTPFHQGYMLMIEQCALERSRSKKHGSIDFVFDEIDDTQYLELLHSYKNFKALCPDAATKDCLGAEPTRRDDRLVLPLQAADLFAGAVRRAYQERDEQATEIVKAITIPNRAVELDAATLERWHQLVAKKAPLLGQSYETAKERSRRLKSARQLLKK